MKMITPLLAAIGAFFFSCSSEAPASAPALSSADTAKPEVQARKPIEKGVLFAPTVWVYDVSSLPDSLRDKRDNVMTIDSNVHFNGNVMGKLHISGDTISITSRLLADNNMEGLEFKGIITSLSADTLRLTQLKGYFPIRLKNQTLARNGTDEFVFFNEKLLKKTK